MVDPEFRELERLRFEASCNEASALANAERKGRAQRDIEIAKRLLNAGDTVDKVIAITDLTRAEVEGIQDAN
jgi:hypothetical protein